MNIITSILDTDLYKFTQCYAVTRCFPNTNVVYQFTDRGDTTYPESFKLKLLGEIEHMKHLYLTRDERTFLHDTGLFPNSFLDFLSGYRFDPSEVAVRQVNGKLEMTVYGPWYRTILWEVPLLTIVSELYYREKRETDEGVLLSKFQNRDNKKIDKLIEEGVKFADFGTRRRYSKYNHERVARICANRHSDPLNVMFVGSSNVDIARKLRIKPIGTMAHEWIMVHGAIYGYKQANRMALDNWARVYRGSLGIALSDTYTTDVFFKSFDKYHAKLFDGVRQDSGDPIVFAEKTIQHYERLGIDPITKTIVFSDSLNANRAIEIHNWCRGKIKTSFGIGTNLTNDVDEARLNIVMKVREVETEMGVEQCVKLSDDHEKHTGDPKEVDICKKVLSI